MVIMNVVLDKDFQVQAMSLFEKYTARESFLSNATAMAIK